MHLESSTGVKSGLDFVTGAWKYDSLIAETVFDLMVVFIPPEKWGEDKCVQAKRKELLMWEKFKVVGDVPDQGQELKILTKWILVENN